MLYKPNEFLLNKYRIETPVGHGSFGQVYLVTHLDLNVRRALKVLRRDAPGMDSFGFDNFRRRFHLEAQLGAQLNARRPHPNLLQVYDFQNSGDLLALEMEYAPGGSLAERLKEARAAGQPLAIDEVLQTTLDVAQGLAAIHSMDVVHRDIKPSNILLAYNRAKVGDLGIAQVAGGPSLRSTSSDGRLVPHPGTPGYMSPEQEHTGAYLKPPSDIYALGLVAFEMLTGRNYSSLRAGTRASHLRPDTPSWLDDLLVCMLAQDPGSRPWDGSELTRMLLANMRQMPGIIAVQAVSQETVQMTPRPVTVVAATERVSSQIPAPVLTHTSTAAYPPVSTQADAQQTPATLERGRPSPRALVGSGLAALAVIALTLVVLAVALKARPNQPPAAAVALQSATAIPTTAAPTLAAGTATGLAPEASPTALQESGGAPAVSAKQESRAASTATPETQSSPTPTRDPALPPLSPKAGDLWTNSVDQAAMVYIPAGEFTMGATGLQSGALAVERPPHPVTVDAFWIGQTEVTNQQYARCVRAGKCRPPLTAESFTRQQYYGNSAYDQYPVVFVSWDDASAYCTWAGGRLPTEAEWEKAARGEDQRSYPWGEKLTCSNANYWEYEREDRPSGSYTLTNLGCQKDTVAVGSYPSGASPYGVLDMAGNVGEWVSDWFGEYSSSPQDNPTGPQDGKFKVVRGYFGFFQPKVTSSGSSERSVSSGPAFGGGNIHYWGPPTASRTNTNKTVSGKGNLISGYTFYFVLRDTFRSQFPPSSADYNIGFRCAMPPAP